MRLLVFSWILGMGSFTLAEEAQDTFNLANGVFIVGDYQTALGYYEEVLKKTPDFPQANEALFRKAECLFRLKKYSESATDFELLVARYPQFKESHTAFYRLGEIYFTHLNKFDKAADSYGQIVKADPAHKLADSAFYFQGESFLKLKEYDRAIAAYQQLLKNFPDSEYAAATHYSLGWAFFFKGDYGSALSPFETVVNRFPKEATAAECQFKKAEALFHLRKFEEAQQAYQESIDKFPGDFSDDASLGIGRCLFERGEKEKAGHLFLDTARKYPKSENAAVALFNAGSSFFATAKFDAAMAAFDEQIKAQPDSPNASSAHYWRGRCLLKLGRNAEARDQFKELAGKESTLDRAGILYGVGDAHFALGQFADAASQYAAVSKDFPAHDLADDSAYSYCLCLEKLAQTDEGISKADAFLQSFPQSPHANPVRFLLGEFHYRKGAYDKAIPYYQQVFDAGGELGDDALYKLGWSQRLSQKPLEARSSFSKLAEDFKASPFTPEARYLAGKITDEPGVDDPAAALKILDAVTAEYPNSPFGPRAAFEAALVPYQRNQFEPAIARLEAFLQKYPQSDFIPHAMLHLAESYFETGKTEQALAGYTRLLKEHPNGPVAAPARYGHAWCLRKEKKLEEAAAEFEKVAVDHPGDALAPEGLYWSGLCLEEARKFETGLARFQKLLEQHKASPFAEESSYRLGTCTFGMKKFPEALALFQQFVETYPKSDWADNAWYDMAWCCRELQQPDPMKAAYQKVVAEFDKSDVLGESCFALGEIEYEAKVYETAEAHYLKSIETRQPGVLDRGLYKLAWTQFHQKKLGESVATLRRLIAETPDSPFVPEAHYRIGRIQQSQAAHDQAAAAFEKCLALAKEGEFAEAATFQIAESYRELKEWGKAAQYYRQAVQNYPKAKTMPEALYGVGLSTLELGALKDAEEAFEQVVKQTDSTTAARAQLGLGEIRFRQGQFEEAAKQFLKVNFLYGYPEWKQPALFMAAQSFQKMNKVDQARKYYQLLVETYPDTEFGKKAKEEMGKLQNGNP